MAFCSRCGAQLEGNERFCGKCGSDVTAMAAVQAASLAPSVQAVAQAAYPSIPPAAPPPPPPGVYPGAPPTAAPYPYAAAQGPPPGMTAVMYQAYPGGPQQMYYIPTASMHPNAQSGLLAGLRSQIRNLASTESLEGFSFGQLFSEVFKRHGTDAEEEYFMAGAPKTTPALDLVETGWPKPWMFFRLLAVFVIAFAALYVSWIFTQNVPLLPAIMIMGAFGVPVATMVLLFEMNTPRNVSMVVLGRLFLIGGLAGLCVVSFEYMKLPGSAIIDKIPGIVEETAKLGMVILVVRSVRYKYELNGILFGAAVGAGFGSFETTFYGFQSLLGGLGQGADAAAAAMVNTLVMRAVLAPFMHVTWTAIAAGAFWRVKQDRPFSAGMLGDGRFLKAFAIPVVMHTAWDISILLPNLNGLVDIGIWIATGLITWYVLFGMVQQGLRQVKQEQVTHLQSALATVEATLGLGTMRA